MSISELVAKYELNRTTYLKDTYNETQLRTDFLDPLFELLGWDIKNSTGKTTNEREVLLEESLKCDANSNAKKPDYTFRLFAERKYFLEAKKPSVSIETDLNSVKQLRRYGFTAKLKISVLSNFEYIAIYDCSNPVSEEDTVTFSRIAIYHYSEYESAFEEIQSQLGRAEVYNGSFDKKWSHIEDQIRLSSVDDLFLAQINQWRIELGTEIYKNKPDLTDEQLNDVVQRYINSIIFLRVCEDRNLEVYKTLLNCADNDDYSALISNFRQADKNYNAGLFNQLMVDDIVANNRSAFWTIIRQLYFPESTYSFSVFASDILGNIYEIFLGQQLKIINNEIKLVKKPEHEDRDIVTTPTFIIQDILRETVVNFCKDKSDTEILESSIADIACGSGAFLLETYQLLNDTLVDYYLNHDKQRLIQTSVDSFKLPYEIKRSIVENCIFGVDKDYNAVQACKFGLLLKLLENEDQTTITRPALPNIDESINFGNSLIGSNLPYNENINPFDFGDKKFDVVVGNPPYMTTEDINKFTPMELPIYRAEYDSAFKQFDKYFLFIERGLNLLKKDGYFGYIIPSKFTKVGAAKNLRTLLKNSGNLEKIVSFGANQIFQDKTTYTCLLILKNSPSASVNYVEIENVKDWKIRNISEDNFDEIDTNELSDDGWVLIPAALKSVYENISKTSQSLEALIGADNIFNGIQTSANSVYIHKAIKEDDKYLHFIKDGHEWKVEKTLTRPYFQTKKGANNLNTYRPFAPNSFVIYPYLKTKEGLEFVDIERLENEFNHAFKYLMHYRDKLDNERRDIQPAPVTTDEWYRYGRHQSLENCDVPAKIIVGVLSKGDKYAIDYHGTLISSGGTAGYCMITLPDKLEYSVYYIQALLNSKYLEWFSALIGEVFRGGYIARGTKVLKKLPIRVINFADKDEKTLHDEIAKSQKELIRLQGLMDINIGNNRKLIPIRRQFNKLKSELDENLKSLYNLGKEDSLVPLISEIYATD